MPKEKTPSYELLMLKCTTEQIIEFMKFYKIDIIHKIGYVDGQNSYLEKRYLRLTPKKEPDSILNEDNICNFPIEEFLYWYIDMVDVKFPVEEKFIPYINAAKKFRTEFINRGRYFLEYTKENVYVSKFLIYKGFAPEFMDIDGKKILFNVLPSVEKNFEHYKKMASDFFQDDTAKFNIIEGMIQSRIARNIHELKDPNISARKVYMINVSINNMQTNLQEFYNSYLLELSMTLNGVRIYCESIPGKKGSLIEICGLFCNHAMLKLETSTRRSFDSQKFNSVEELKMFLISQDLPLSRFTYNPEWWEL